MVLFALILEAVFLPITLIFEVIAEVLVITFSAVFSSLTCIIPGE